MNKTKIEWTNGGYTWNPVTGCLHGCPYCYARGIIRRLGRATIFRGLLEDRCFNMPRKGSNPYPFGVYPTFHRYRLDDPQSVKRPSNVFVCSMADLFGEWVPDEWIEAVFDACAKAPQHRYLFLTKNSKRYCDLFAEDKLPVRDNFWYGATVTNNDDEFFYSRYHNAFLSFEPLMGKYDTSVTYPTKWVIVGAETGNRKGKVVPKREWIENIITACKAENVPIFMKRNLVGIFDEAELIQQYPWETAGNERSKS